MNAATSSSSTPVSSLPGLLAGVSGIKRQQDDRKRKQAPHPVYKRARMSGGVKQIRFYPGTDEDTPDTIPIRLRSFGFIPIREWLSSFTPSEQKTHHLCVNVGELEIAMYRPVLNGDISSTATKITCIPCGLIINAGDEDYLYSVWSDYQCWR